MAVSNERACGAWQRRAQRSRSQEIGHFKDVDARGSEAIYDTDGNLAGRATSGGYGWRLGKSLALAHVRPDIGVGAALAVSGDGVETTARVVASPVYDPAKSRTHE